MPHKPPRPSRDDPVVPINEKVTSLPALKMEHQPILMIGGNMFSDQVDVLTFKPEETPGSGSWQIPMPIWSKYVATYEDFMRAQQVLLEYMRSTLQDLPFPFCDMPVSNVELIDQADKTA